MNSLFYFIFFGGSGQISCFVCMADRGPALKEEVHGFKASTETEHRRAAAQSLADFQQGAQRWGSGLPPGLSLSPSTCKARSGMRKRRTRFEQTLRQAHSSFCAKTHSPQPYSKPLARHAEPATPTPTHLSPGTREASRPLRTHPCLTPGRLVTHAERAPCQARDVQGKPPVRRRTDAQIAR